MSVSYSRKALLIPTGRSNRHLTLRLWRVIAAICWNAARVQEGEWKMPQMWNMTGKKRKNLNGNGRPDTSGCLMSEACCFLLSVCGVLSLSSCLCVYRRDVLLSFLSMVAFDIHGEEKVRRERNISRDGARCIRLPSNYQADSITEKRQIRALCRR